MRLLILDHLRDEVIKTFSSIVKIKYLQQLKHLKKINAIKNNRKKAKTKCIYNPKILSPLEKNISIYNHRCIIFYYVHAKFIQFM